MPDVDVAASRAYSEDQTPISPRCALSADTGNTTAGVPAMTRQTFTERLIELIRRIPAGKVATYGQLSAMAGNPRAARQVARVLHTCSQKEDLPWHRVVNREGRIALKLNTGGAKQKRLLEYEGVGFDAADTIDLDVFLRLPDRLR